MLLLDELAATDSALNRNRLVGAEMTAVDSRNCNLSHDLSHVSRRRRKYTRSCIMHFATGLHVHVSSVFMNSYIVNMFSG